MDEEEYNGINFRNSDIDNLAGRDLYKNGEEIIYGRYTSKGQIKNGRGSSRFESVTRTSGANITSERIGRMRSFPGDDHMTTTKSKFKQIKQKPNGDWVVGKLRMSPITGTYRATERTISGAAAQRKMKRMRGRMGDMFN